MTPLSGTRVAVESAIQERSGSEVEIPVGEGGGIEVAPIGEVFKDGVVNVDWDEASV